MQYILDNILLPLVIGGIGAYAYPRIESYIKNRSLSSRQRKLLEILREYGIVKSYIENPISLVVSMLFFLTLGLVVLLALVFLITIGVYTPLPPNNMLGFFVLVLMGYMSIYSINFLLRMANRHNDSKHFNAYKEKTIVNIKKLGLDIDVTVLNGIDSLSADDLKAFISSLERTK